MTPIIPEEESVATDRKAATSPSNIITDGDSSTEGSVSPDLGGEKSDVQVTNTPPSLNVNAPAFTSLNLMTPVLITKNIIDIGNERWKPNATIAEENMNSIPIGDLPQPFIGADGLCYWPADLLSSYPATVVVDQPVDSVNLMNGATGVQTYVSTGQPVINNIHVDVPKAELKPDELKRLIQLQFEYYFSRENLANDSYLVSQMDSDQFVSIATVAKFNQIRKLTSNMDVIIEALKESPYVQLDENAEKVRANVKRCIVILREIPEDTPTEEVKAIFSHPDCPPWVTFEFAHNDSWYITFDCEEDARQAYRYLREQVQTFRGKPLLARIKAKPLMSRSVYLPKGSPNQIGDDASSSTSSKDTVVTAQPPQFQPNPPPIGPFPMAPNAVFQQPAATGAFPIYPNAAPINGATFIQGGWLGHGHPPHFIYPEVRHKHAKHNGYNQKGMSTGQRSFYHTNKQRGNFRNSYQRSNNTYEQRNGFIDNDERTHTHRKFNNSGGGNISAYSGDSTSSDGSVGTNRRDDVKNSRRETRKDPRMAVEESPRFQRLRERRARDESLVKPHGNNTMKKTDGSPGNAEDLDINLALEDFPALPSPNSPNELKTAASLKELASNALQTSPDSTNQAKTVTSEMSSSLVSEVTEQDTKISVVTTTAASQIPPPKISYAQIAQKPQQKNSSNSSVSDSDERNSLEWNSTADSTIDSQLSSPGPSDSVIPSSSLIVDGDLDIKDNSINTTTPVQTKETYASRFGKAAPPAAAASKQPAQSGPKQSPPQIPSTSTPRTSSKKTNTVSAAAVTTNSNISLPSNINKQTNMKSNPSEGSQQSRTLSNKATSKSISKDISPKNKTKPSSIR